MNEWNNVKGLASAIIVKAIKDYKLLKRVEKAGLKEFRIDGELLDVKKELKKIEKFFHSEHIAFEIMDVKGTDVWNKIEVKDVATS